MPRQGVGAGDALVDSRESNSLIEGAGGDRMFGLAGDDALNSKDNVNGNVSGGDGTDTKLTDATEARILGFP